MPGVRDQTRARGASFRTRTRPSMSMLRIVTARRAASQRADQRSGCGVGYVVVATRRVVHQIAADARCAPLQGDQLRFQAWESRAGERARN